MGCKVYIGGRREHVLKASAVAAEMEGLEGALVPVSLWLPTWRVKEKLTIFQRLVMDVVSQISIDAAVNVIQASVGKLDILVNK